MTDPLPTYQCTTHHHACDCREAKVAELAAAAGDSVRGWQSYCETESCTGAVLKQFLTSQIRLRAALDALK